VAGHVGAVARQQQLEVASDVRRVNRAKASADGVMSIVFERDGGYFLARYDLRALARLSEQRVEPSLL
jgi:hypothetical protein